MASPNLLLAAINQWLTIRGSIVTSVIPHTGQENFLPFLQQGQQAGGFDLLYFGTEQGSMHHSIPERGASDTSYDPRTRGWYRDAKAQNRQILSNVYADAITRQLMVTIAEPISRHGRLFGVIGADVLIEQLVKDVIAIDAGAKSSALLVNGNTGNIIAHRNADLILKPLNTYSSNLTMAVINQSIKDNQVQEVKVGGVDKFFFFSKVPSGYWVLNLINLLNWPR